MIHLSQTALLDVFFDQIDMALEAVHHADVQNLSRLLLRLLHLKRLSVIDGRGLLAQHMLSRPQGIHGYDGMHFIGRTDIYRLHLRVRQNLFVIRHCSAAVFIIIGGCPCPLRNDVAEIQYFRMGIYFIAGNMMDGGNASAAYDCQFDLVHSFSPIPPA